MNLDIGIVGQLLEPFIHAREVVDCDVPNNPVALVVQEPRVAVLHLYQALAIYECEIIITHLGCDQIPSVRVGLGVMSPIPRDIEVVVDEAVRSKLQQIDRTALNRV